MSNRPERDTLPSASFPGPGYSGFGGSAGYTGGGAGGIAGGYAGEGYTDGPWRPVPDTLHDDRIASDVKERLAQASELDATEIEVAVEAGAVTLEGRVATRDLKHAATSIAERTPGVHRVHNRIHVDQPLLEELHDKLVGRPSTAR